MITINKQQLFLIDLARVLKCHSAAICSKLVKSDQEFTEVFFQMTSKGETVNIYNGRMHNTSYDVTGLISSIVTKLEVENIQLKQQIESLLYKKEL